MFPSLHGLCLTEVRSLNNMHFSFMAIHACSNFFHELLGNTMTSKEIPLVLFFNFAQITGISEELVVHR